MADHLNEPYSVSTTATDDRDSSDRDSDQLANGESSTASKLVQSSRNGDDNVIRSPEALAKGISTMLASVIRDFDSKAVDASNSQDKLCSAIDRLTGELDQLLEDAPLPFILQHAAKLSNVRKRVSSLNSLLRSIQRRLDSIDRMLSVGLPNDKSNVGGPK